MPDGKLGIVCNEPNCVPTDWQIVEFESPPCALVRDLMTTAVVSAEPGTPVSELARLMLDRQVNRLMVLDPPGCPVGVVTVNDLLQVMAHPELATPGGRSAVGAGGG